jgi:hypothetical protein
MDLCKITDATSILKQLVTWETAYIVAAGHTNPDFLNLGAGTIGGKNT